MPEHWRLGSVERSVLESFDQLGARPDRPHTKCAKVVDRVAQEFGVSPRYGYGALCAMAQPWLQNVPLVDFHGNYGSPDDDPAPPRYTEARLAPAGVVALAGERGTGPAVPAALINGSLHVDGTAPPFSPTRVVATLLALAEGPELSDAEIIERVGPPESPTGCGIACDIGELGAGKPTTLVMTAAIDYEEGEHELVIALTRFPLGVGCETIMQAIGSRVPGHERRDPDWDPADLDELDLPLRDVRNMSHGQTEKIVCLPNRHYVLDLIEPRLAAIWGVRTRTTVQLPAPLPVLMRELADQDPAALRSALAALVGR